jgi:hypothetical protein
MRTNKKHMKDEYRCAVCGASLIGVDSTTVTLAGQLVNVCNTDECSGNFVPDMRAGSPTRGELLYEEEDES